VVIEACAADSALARRVAARVGPRVPVERVERFVVPPLGNARAAKTTLVVTNQKIPRLERFQYCQDFSFHLAAGCPLHCAYCTLLYRLPRFPYLQAYANTDEIFAMVEAWVSRSPDPMSILVAGDNTDVLAMEPLLGTLRETIEFFGRRLRGRARLEFLSKSPEVDCILDAEHRQTTSVGYSLNTPRVIEAVEHATASLDERLVALRKALRAGYSLFLNIAPIFPYEGWRAEYGALLERCRDELGSEPGFSEDQIRMECEVHWQKEDEVALSESLYPSSDHALLRSGKERVVFADGSALFRVDAVTYAEVRDFFETEMARLFPNAASRLMCPPADPVDRPDVLVPTPIDARRSPE